MYVARLRYIQSVREPAERRNPDNLVRYFLPWLQRVRVAWMSRGELSRLRAEPFYFHLVARTRHYDQVVSEAIEAGVKRILMIGCGSDTRAYRFQRQLRANAIKVLECDQREAILIKEQLARRWRPADYVNYLDIDLNNESWPPLEAWLGSRNQPPALVMLEGVCGYVNHENFHRFLQFLAQRLPAGSQLAYDFKISGIKDDFGRTGRTLKPFRLPNSRSDVADYHQALGFSLDLMETGAELRTRHLPGLKESDAPLFEEDAVLRLTAAGS